MSGRNYSAETFLSPQRDAIAQPQSSGAEVLSDVKRGKLRECADSLTRYIEASRCYARESGRYSGQRDSAFGRTDEPHDAGAVSCNRNFPAAGLVDGATRHQCCWHSRRRDPYAFWIVVIMLFAVVAVQIGLFQRLGLLGKNITVDS